MATPPQTAFPDDYDFQHTLLPAKPRDVDGAAIRIDIPWMWTTGQRAVLVSPAATPEQRAAVLERVRCVRTPDGREHPAGALICAGVELRGDERHGWRLTPHASVWIELERAYLDGLRATRMVQLHDNYDRGGDDIEMPRDEWRRLIRPQTDDGGGDNGDNDGCGARGSEATAERSAGDGDSDDDSVRGTYEGYFDSLEYRSAFTRHHGAVPPAVVGLFWETAGKREKNETRQVTGPLPRGDS